MGINRLDLIQARGGYKLPEGAPETLGLEVSGTVVETGTACQKGFADGDEVIALLNGYVWLYMCICVFVHVFVCLCVWACGCVDVRVRTMMRLI